MDGLLARIKAETSSAFAFSVFVAERVALGSILVLRTSGRLSMSYAPAGLPHPGLGISIIGLS